MKLIINTSLAEACSISNHCQWQGRSPLEVLSHACGIKDREPLRFTIEDFFDLKTYHTLEDVLKRRPESHKKGAQNRIYLSLLSQLLNWDETKVSAALENTRGLKRLYFSKDKKSISQPHMIHISSWYACTQLPAELKRDILYELLCKLDFTDIYARRISVLVMYKSPRIAGLHFELDDAL